MMLEAKLTTGQRAAWSARLRRICSVAACSCLMVFCLTASPVFADELDQFLDKAEQSMRESADSLRSRNADQSVGHQSSAIRNLEQYLVPDPDGSANDLQQDQQVLRDRLKKLQEQLAKRGLGQKGQKGQGGQQGDQGDQADQGDQSGGDQGDGEDGLGAADNAMGDAIGKLGEGNADGAVDSQGRALDALRKGAQSMADAMQQGEGQGDGPGDHMGRQQNGSNQTDPLGRPLRSRELGDELSKMIPGEIDVQRARRILEELRRRLGEPNRPQIELDYIERLLKDY